MTPRPPACRDCGAADPESGFYPPYGKHKSPHPYCRACWRQKVNAYQARPEVAARRKADPRRKEQMAAATRAWRSTPVGRIKVNLSCCRCRLRRESDPGKAAKLERLVALWEAELARHRAG